MHYLTINIASLFVYFSPCVTSWLFFFINITKFFYCQFLYCPDYTLKAIIFPSK